MAGINDLFAKIKKIEDEIRSLQGRISRIAVGNQIITNNIPGTVPVPTAVDGAMIVGNSTPAWERLAHPTPTTGQKYGLTFDYGDTQPVWRQGGSGRYRQFTYTVNPATPDFTFIIDSGGNPVFVLQDLE